MKAIRIISILSISLMTSVAFGHHTDQDENKQAPKVKKKETKLSSKHYPQGKKDSEVKKALEGQRTVILK